MERVWFKVRLYFFLCCLMVLFISDFEKFVDVSRLEDGYKV